MERFSIVCRPINNEEPAIVEWEADSSLETARAFFAYRMECERDALSMGGVRLWCEFTLESGGRVLRRARTGQ